MKLSTLALSAAALSPVAASGFSMLSPYRFPRMQSLIKEMDELFEHDWPSTMMDEQLARMDKEMAELSKGGLTLRRSSPRYELAESPDKFQVTVEIPDAFKLEDVDVELKADGKLLSITGKHQEKTDDSSFSSTFQQSFSLDPTVVIEELNANFDDGKLVVSAPRKEMLPQLENRKIAVEGKLEVPVVENKHEEEPKEDMKEETPVAP
uniref:SHSP domain-containing protein n=1 Tax=Minutocellus polymorphus TaxID=265543 RepID=A0A7S0ADJ6_9STRA